MNEQELEELRALLHPTDDPRSPSLT